MFLIAAINKTNLKPEDINIYPSSSEDNSIPEESANLHDIFAALKAVAKQTEKK
ncbi:hypothetical protein [Vibrio injensis]|uniref:hypothetical protein n=1 Tax=Vibrio injensis TaxID=1307414 RepID=UPI001428CAB3|nr:hypothetical protein [Vibrio injensis]